MKAFEKNKFVKTQKGYELYSKVIGLKNYIQDYSNLSESELKEIYGKIIWYMQLFLIIHQNLIKKQQIILKGYINTLNKYLKRVRIFLTLFSFNK